MARTALTVNQVLYTGFTRSLSAANADGHSVVNDGKTWIEVANASGGSINVTVQTAGTVDGRAVADDVIAIANGATKLIGPWPTHLYNQSTADGVYVDFSAVSSVTCAAYKL